MCPSRHPQSQPAAPTGRNRSTRLRPAATLARHACCEPRRALPSLRHLCAALSHWIVGVFGGPTRTPDAKLPSFKVFKVHIIIFLAYRSTAKTVAVINFLFLPVRFTILHRPLEFYLLFARPWTTSSPAHVWGPPACTCFLVHPPCI